MKKFLVSVLLLFLGTMQFYAQEEIDSSAYLTFISDEATCRNQKIAMPRSSKERPVTLAEQFRIAFDGANVMDYFDEAYVCITSKDSIRDSIYMKPNDLLKMDPLLLMCDIDKDGKRIKTYDHPTANIHFSKFTSDNHNVFYTISLRPHNNSFGPVYTRTSIMSALTTEDDCRTYNSNSFPTVVSYLTAYDASDSLKYKQMYEELDSAFDEHYKNNIPLNDAELALFCGALEINQYAHELAFPDYLYDEKMYADAIPVYKKQYIDLRDDLTSGKLNDEEKGYFFNICYHLGKCYEKLGIYDKAEYYLGLAAYNDQQYQAELTELQNRPLTDRDFNNYQFADAGRTFDPSCITVGQMLFTLYDILPSYVHKGTVITQGEGRSRLLTKDEAWDLDLKSLCKDKSSAITLYYSKGKGETHSDIDMSDGQIASSILITVVKASEKDSLWRVNIMIPKFGWDEYKENFNDEFNKPYESSFIISNARDTWDLNNLSNMFEKCFILNWGDKEVEAMDGFRFVHTSLKKKYGSMTMPLALKNISQSSDYHYGYALDALGRYDKAFPYLERCAEDDCARITEYVNALVALKDIRTLDIIDRELKVTNDFLKKNKKDEEHIELKHFLLRRKAFYLTEKGDLDAAESIYKEQLKEVKDGSARELINNELQYIQQLRDKQNKQ